MAESERQVNRSCSIAALWVAAVCGGICLLGLAGAFGILSRWMYFYAFTIILPILAVVAYAKWRNYRGVAVKHLMIVAAAAVAASMSVPSLFGFFLMPLPIVVAGRYFSRPFVWHTYANVLLLAFVMTIPHAYYGIPSYPLCDEARETLRLFLDGQFDPRHYWRYLVLYCYPSFAIGLGFFAITVSRLCRDHLDMLHHQAKERARLADVEKGLMLAATANVISSQLSPSSPSSQPFQPDVSSWSMQAIADCISRCKARAAADPDFAALVERNPAQAIREVLL